MKIIWTFTLLMIPGVVRSMSVTGSSGGRVTITCKYDEGYRANVKYFCKGRWSDCADQVKTDGKHKWFQKGRFSLHDDTRSAVFTVTITDLTERDSGTYYCGVEIVGLDPYTEVNLQVITEKTSSLSPPSSSSSPPSSSSPSSSSSPPSSSSAASSSSVKASAFTGVSRTSSSLESLNTSSGSSLIVPLVLVLLVLIISGLSLLFLCGDSSSQTGPGKHEEVSLAGCDYEEIKEIQQQLLTNPSVLSICVYATVQEDSHHIC